MPKLYPSKKKTTQPKPINKNFSEIAYQYCLDVTSGKIKAGPYVILACQRHIDDLKKQKKKNYPYYFDENKANRRCGFSQFFSHVKGKWTGKQIILEPHQVFIDCAIWGWMKKSNHMRRFSTAYIEMPRKQGKSIQSAIAGLYMLASDGEKGAEIYSGATSEKQAMEVFRPAWMMMKKNNAFREHLNLSLSGNPRNPTSIYRLSDMSRFEPLIGKPGEGASPHCAIIDEYHEHRTSEQYDTMDTGMGSRGQPLIFVITTAGTDTSTPCYEMHLRVIKILEKTIVDESLFSIIYGILPDSDWKDFETWKMANPNYGVSVDEDYLYRKYTETMNNAAKQNINLCKHLNLWQNAGIAWMNMVKWEACADPSLKLEDFAGQPCYAALDLASKIDICAMILLFRHRREINGEMVSGYATFGKYYLPEDTIKLAGNEHYDRWTKEGWITETPGAMTDFYYIEEDLKEINKNNPIEELAFDPRESGYLIQNIMQWLGADKCIEVTQGPANISEPMKEVEGLIYDNKLWFDGDPVLTWMMSNVIQKRGRNTGPVKYYYPTKEKTESKIDGVVAMIMAMGRAMLNNDVPAYSGMTKEEIFKMMAF